MAFFRIGNRYGYEKYVKTGVVSTISKLRTYL